MAILGRPKLWDAKLAAKICAEIATGTPKSKACVFFGVSEDTFARWRKQRPELERQVRAASRQYEKSRHAPILHGT